MATLEMKEKLVNTDSTAEGFGAKNDHYSEWRLLYADFGGSFQNVTVNKGFQNRDFQTTQGGVSVIDPEMLGKLLKEASTIWKNLVLRSQLAVCALLPAAFLLVLISEDVSLKYFPALCMWGVALLSVVRYLQEKAHRKITELVESYQPVFLEQYGVELGYRPFAYSKHPCIAKLPCISLRRSRRSEDEEAPVDGDSKDMDRTSTTNLPPIYLVRLIPGQIHINTREYDATSMKVDAETWALLQTTHRQMIQLYRGVRVYEEVTKVVNEALQKDENKVHMSVEFHDSECPGREGNFARRYQFVQRASAPVGNTTAGVGWCWA